MERCRLPPSIAFVVSPKHTQLQRVAPPLKIGLLFKRTLSEYSHRRLIKEIKIWEWNQSLIKVQWTALKLDSIYVVKTQRSHSPLSCVSVFTLFFPSPESTDVVLVHSATAEQNCHHIHICLSTILEKALAFLLPIAGKIPFLFCSMQEQILLV